MPIVDAQGRLFGRLNLLDAVIAILLLGLIPLAYGAYVMFRAPEPRLLAVEPTALVNGSNLRVTIRGENLRPFMRVSFNDIQGNSFIFRNASEAQVDLGVMPPGVYDVVLYDYAQERSRLPNAFTLQPTPLPASQVILVGTVGNLTAERAGEIKRGMTLAGVGEVLAVGAPLPETTRVIAGPVLEIPIEKAVRVPVEVRAGCSVRAPQGVPQCVIGDAVVAPTSLLLVKTPLGVLPLQVDQIRGTQPLEPVRVTVQFTNRRELLQQVQRGDRDFGEYMNPLSAGAAVVDIGSAQVVGADIQRVDVTLTAQAQRGSSSWIYAAAPLRAGTNFTLRTPQYELQGVVLTLDPEWTPAPGGDSSQNGATR
jgi:hypothetical protein